MTRLADAMMQVRREAAPVDVMIIVATCTFLFARWWWRKRKEQP